MEKAEMGRAVLELRGEKGMNAEGITRCLMLFVLTELNHHCAVPRFNLTHGECDVLSVTRTAFLHEFEIKISKSDFNKDKKKRKWWYYDKPSLSESFEVPNYFWYVFPAGMIPVEYVDQRFGVIEISHDSFGILNANMRRKPIRLSGLKCRKGLMSKISRSLSFRFATA